MEHKSHDTPTQIAQRVTRSPLAQELNESAGAIFLTLAEYFAGDLVTLFSEEPGVTPQVRELAEISLRADATLMREFVGQVVHMARNHGLEATRRVLAEWKQKLETIDMKIDTMTEGKNT